MSFFAKMLSVFVASTNHTPTTIATNAFQETTGLSINVPAPTDVVEREFQKILAADDAALAEVDRLVRDNQAFLSNGGGLPGEELNRRIEERLQPVRQLYDNFLGQHTNHARAHLAYGSFLDETKDEEAAAREWEKSLAFDPANPAAWNNLANYYGHRSPVKKAFAYYARAIELNPNEPLYYHNFGTTVYLFRHDAMDFYCLNEQQVFDKALELYNRALTLDPENFLLASDLAQTYYGIKPFRAAAAQSAWEKAYDLARDDIERQGIRLHFARLRLKAGQPAAARAHLAEVTNAMYAEVKQRLLRNIEAQTGHAPAATNEASAEVMQDPKIWRLDKTPTTKSAR